MTKFFRRIRQKLLSENKFSKYMPYAIGEILLVVIGILIALQINNWNENQKLLKKEHDTLVLLTQELENNTEQLHAGINANKKYMNSINSYLKETFKRQNLNSDIFKMIMSYNSAGIKTPVLDDILETDRSTIISNNSYLNNFRKLKISYSLIEKQEFYLDEFWNSKVTKFMIEEEVPLDDLVSKKDVVMKNEKLKNLSNSQKLITILSIKALLQNEWLNQQITAHRKSLDVLTKLKQDFKND